VHPDYQEIVKERIRQLTEEGAQVEWMEQKLLRFDGRVIDVEVAAAPFTYQGIRAAQVVVRDISDRKFCSDARLLEEVGHLGVYTSNHYQRIEDSEPLLFVD
jgi:PAS domain S-box-containing protein